MKKLKIISTIKIALQIYRDRFKEYYCLAFRNSFWIFVPVYGWAKYAAMMGLIARLAYGDVTGNSETVREAKRHIKPKTWSFFGAGLMETYTFYLKLFLLFIPLRIAILIIIGTENYPVLINSLFWTTALLLAFYYYYWVLSHLFLYELPLAIDRNISVSQSRNNSWKMVEGSVSQLQIMIFGFSCIFVCSLLIFLTLDKVAKGDLSHNPFTSINNFSTLKIFKFFFQTLFSCGALFIPNLSLAIGVLFKTTFNTLQSENIITPYLLAKDAGLFHSRW